MSAIAAILRLDEKPSAGEDVTRMLGALSIYGPDRQGLWHDQTIALGHRLFVVVPEDRLKPQPLTGGDGQVRVVADARIDNRDDLVKTLGLEPSSKATWPDGCFILAAYERWGIDCCEHLVGSFAFAIWDAPNHRLFCGRDHLGDRPLFYHQAHGFTAIASMPKGLHALPDIPRQLDEGTLRASLALLRHDRTATLFRGVSRVPAGHALIVTESGVKLHRYWSADQAAMIRFKRNSDYVEAARALLEDAVACRLRRVGGIGAHLSGGLDSAAVAATAARLLSAENVKLAAFTAVPRHGFVATETEGGRFADEWPHAQAVASMYPNIDHVPVHNPDRSPLTEQDRAIFAYDRYILNFCNSGWLTAIVEAARERRVRVMLSAEFGNLAMSYDGLSLLANALASGHWATVVAESFALARRGTLGPYAILRTAIAPLLPAVAWSVSDRLRGLRRSNEPLSYSALRVEELALASRAASAAGMPSDLRQWRLDRTGRARALARINVGEYRLGLLATHGIDQRDPTMDKRLVEFCLAIPEQQFLRGGVTRSLHRRVMEGALPPVVLHETRRGLQAADWHVSLTAARAEVGGELDRLEHSALASRLLDLPRLRRLVDAWPTEGWRRPNIVANYRFALLRAISVGKFIRSVEGGNQ